MTSREREKKLLRITKSISESFIQNTPLFEEFINTYDIVYYKVLYGSWEQLSDGEINAINNWLNAIDKLKE